MEGQKAQVALWAIATVGSSTGSIRAKTSRFAGQCEQRCGRLKPLFERLTRAGGNRARTDRGITQLQQHKLGRPSNYNAEIAWAICDRLVEGESLRRICSDAGMPGKATVFRWIARHKEFRDRYISARDFQAEGLCVLQWGRSPAGGVEFRRQSRRRGHGDIPGKAEQHQKADEQPGLIDLPPLVPMPC